MFVCLFTITLSYPPGKIIDPGSTVLPVNKAGFKLNSALHETGHNIVYHTPSHAGTAVSQGEREEEGGWGAGSVVYISLCCISVLYIAPGY